MMNERTCVVCRERDDIRHLKPSGIKWYDGTVTYRHIDPILCTTGQVLA